MLAEFIDQLSSKPWGQPGQKFLLAVSGGIDSVVMAHLFHQAPYSFGIAHCNFKLRGEASEEDERFVHQLAQDLEAPFFCKSFDTETLAKANQQSIQMEARDLRYSWLEAVRTEAGFNWIATAHHLNDSTETFFYNFAKGTGIHGLLGIPERNGRVIRPLLSFTKTAINDFQKNNRIAYREDQSNVEDKYARNKIRHHVLPILEQINPNLIQTAGQNIQRLQETAALMGWAVHLLKEQFWQEEKEEIKIKKAGLEHLPGLKTVMYEWLHPFGFNSSQVDQLLDAHAKQAGRIFESPSHILLDDRQFFILTPIDESYNEKEYFTINWEAEQLELPNGQLILDKKTGIPNQFPLDQNIAYLQLESKHFPLRIRHWQAGDTFQPLGMQGKHQKVQDFFSNKKVTRIEKKRIWLVETKRGEICWIIGHRIDERFKLLSNSEHFVALTFLIKP